MRDDIVTLYKRAHKIAIALGHYRHADDFAGWYICRILEGKCQHQLLRHAFFDYYAQEHKNLNTDMNIHLRQIPDKSENFTKEDKLVILNLLEKHATPLEKRIYQLYLVEGYFLKEIGEMFGVSESRIAQRFTQFVKRIYEEEFKNSD